MRRGEAGGLSGVRALSGRPVGELTLEAVRRGEIGLEDLRIHPETLEWQAAVAEQMMGKMLAPDADKTRPTVAQELRAIMESCPPKTIEHALQAMRDRPDRSGELPSIKVPTLILVGEHDAITPPAAAEQMQRAISKSQLAIVQGAGHMTPMEQPEQVNRALREFVQQLSH